MNQPGRLLLICLWVALWGLPNMAAAQGTSPPTSQQAPSSTPFKEEQIEQLVAPIALYPDSLVAQILMASTYPLEVVDAARWVKANPKVTGKALEDAMQQQKWDASVKSLTAFPQVLTMMNAKLDSTEQLGDAFLGQQKDVMAAIQRLRAKAQAAGNLKSSSQQKVETAQEGSSTVIKIEPAQPDVVYVPTYNPALIYGAWPYPDFPPYYWYPPGYAAGAAVFGFTAGVIVGSALWGHCDWGVGNVNINVNKFNSFNKTNITNANWTHNPAHRGGVPYHDAASQQKYGRHQLQNSAARDQFRGRADQGRQQLARGGFDHAGGRGGAFEGTGFGGGQMHDFSSRGAFSRGGMGGGFRGGGFRRR
jgi:uncharacterized membrane protein YgcG